jgi:hypothetical protein
MTCFFLKIMCKNPLARHMRTQEIDRANKRNMEEMMLHMYIVHLDIQLCDIIHVPRHRTWKLKSRHA